MTKKKKAKIDYGPDLTSMWIFPDLDDDPQIREWRENIDKRTVYYS